MVALHRVADSALSQSVLTKKYEGGPGVYSRCRYSTLHAARYENSISPRELDLWTYAAIPLSSKVVVVVVVQLNERTQLTTNDSAGYIPRARCALARRQETDPAVFNSISSVNETLPSARTPFAQ